MDPAVSKQGFCLLMRRVASLGFPVTLTDPLGCLLTLQMVRKGQRTSALKDAPIQQILSEALEATGALEFRKLPNMLNMPRELMGSIL